MIIGWPENNKDNSEDTVCGDVQRHTTAWRDYLFSGDPMTTSHETTHRVNSDIRNKQGGNVNAFYLLNSKALVCNEPNFSKSKVAQYIPDNLRESRFSTYVTGMTEWNDRPLYLWDEWTAYTNGAFCAAQLKQENKYPGDWSDWSMGPLEFNCYGLAVMAACKGADNEAYKQLIPGFSLLWNRGWMAFFDASPYFPWDRQDAFLKNFRNLQSGPLHDIMQENNFQITIKRFSRKTIFTLL